MSHTAYKQERDRRHGPPPEYDDRVLQLLECIRSGQVEPSQYVEHFQAGDLNQGESNGRKTED